MVHSAPSSSSVITPLYATDAQNFPAARERWNFFICTCSLWNKLLSLHLWGFLLVSHHTFTLLNKCDTDMPLWFSLGLPWPETKAGEEHVPSEQRFDNSVALVMQSSCYLFTTQQCRKGTSGVSLDLHGGYFDHLNWSSLWDFLNKFPFLSCCYFDTTPLILQPNALKHTTKPLFSLIMDSSCSESSQWGGEHGRQVCPLGAYTS